MANNKNFNGGRWSGFWIGVLSGITTGGITCLYFCLRENKRTKEAKKRTDYTNKKKAEDRQKRREEEAAAQEKAQRQAEEDLKNQVNSEVSEMDDPMPANELIDSAPEEVKSTRLYANLIHKGNIVVVFGPKGEGKSILTNQMIVGIVTGTPGSLFPEFGQQHEGRHGIIIDFEQSPAQLKGRYGKKGYRFPDNLDFVRGKAFSKLESFKAYLKALIGKLNRDTVIAIDNLTKALPIMQDESTRDLFRFLNGCIESAKREKEIDLTFVLVAHANKDGYGASIGTEHLKGTSKVADYADLVLAIGPTRFGKSTKMLKVLNNRNEPEPEKVLVMKIVDSAPLLHFERVREMREEDALPRRSKCGKKAWFVEEEYQGEEVEQATERFTHEEKVEMWRLKTEKGQSLRNIVGVFEAKGKSISAPTVGKFIDEIKAEKAPKDTD